MTIWYASREDVKFATDAAGTTRDDAQIDRALDAATDAIEGATGGRRFYPELTTRYFDWPSRGGSTPPWRLWLDGNELISATTVTSGGTVMDPSTYNLRRSDDRDEPPYTYLETNLATNSGFNGGSTWQRSIAILGLYGFTDAETIVAELAAAVSAGALTVDVSDSAGIGVGNLLRFELERVIVTRRSALTTGQSVATPLTALMSDVIVAVADGTAISVGETLLIDAEYMQVVDIAGNNVIVKRAVNGSVLATHTASTIYAPRRLTVTRGVLGTVDASHVAETSVRRHEPPPLIQEWAMAEAINAVLQKQAGYARTSGSGDNEREARMSGLADIRRRGKIRFGRRHKHAAV